METDKIYTIVVKGKPAGPFSLDELKEMNIRSGTFVRSPGMDDYKEAHAIPELRALFNLKAIQTAPQYFAGFDLRMLASVIDYFLITLVLVLLVTLSFIFISGMAFRLSLIIALAPALPVLKFVYGCIADASASQGTIGKRIVNIKVTDMQGNRITFVNSVGRNFAKILSTAPLFFGYLYSFLNKKQQCWHDLLTDTLVIKDRLI